MAVTHSTTPTSTIEEGGNDELKGWDSSAGQDVFFPAGTAASKDTGTALTEVPTGQDLQDENYVKFTGGAGLVDTNGSAGGTTNFPILEKQTWSPRIEGSSVAGTQTYAEQTGFFWRYGKDYYFTYAVRLSALDAATDGPVLIKGAPAIADPSVAEHMAVITRMNYVNAPAGVIQYAPAFVPQGGLHAVRISVIKDGNFNEFLSASALTGTTEIYGSFKLTVA